MIPTNALLQSLLAPPQIGSQGGNLGLIKYCAQEIGTQKPQLMVKGDNQITNSQIAITSIVKKPQNKLMLPKVFEEQFEKEGENRWRQQNSDITDYFNYGFCEVTFQAYANRVRTWAAKFPLTEDYNCNKYQLDKLKDNFPLDYGGNCIPKDEGLLETPQGFDILDKEQFIRIVLEDYADSFSTKMNKYANNKNDIIGLLQKRNILSKYIKKQTDEESDSKAQNETQIYRNFFANNLSQYSVSDNYSEYRRQRKGNIDFNALQAQIIHNITQKNQSIHPNYLEKVYFLNQIYKKEKNISSLQQQKVQPIQSKTVSKSQNEYQLPTINPFMQRGIMPLPQQQYFQQIQQQYLSQFLKQQMVMGGGQQGMLSMIRNSYMMEGGMNSMGIMGLANMNQQQQMIQFFQMQQQKQEVEEEDKQECTQNSENNSLKQKSRKKKQNQENEDYRRNKFSHNYQKESRSNTGSDRNRSYRNYEDNSPKKNGEKKRKERDYLSEHDNNIQNSLNNPKDKETKSKSIKLKDSLNRQINKEKKSKSRSRSRSLSSPTTYSSQNEKSMKRVKEKKREESQNRGKDKYKKERESKKYRRDGSNDKYQKKERSQSAKKDKRAKNEFEKERQEKSVKDKSMSPSTRASISKEVKNATTFDNNKYNNSKLNQTKEDNVDQFPKYGKQQLSQMKIENSSSLKERIKKKTHPRDIQVEKSRSRSKENRRKRSFDIETSQRDSTFQKIIITKTTESNYHSKQREGIKKGRQLQIIKESKKQQVLDSKIKCNKEKQQLNIPYLSEKISKDHNKEKSTQQSLISDSVTSKELSNQILSSLSNTGISKRPIQDAKTENRKHETHRNFISSFFSALKKNDEREDNFSKVKSSISNCSISEKEQNKPEKSKEQFKSIPQQN